MASCTNCAQALPEGARICPNCGHPVEAPGHAPQTPPAPPGVDPGVSPGAGPGTWPAQPGQVQPTGQVPQPAAPGQAPPGQWQSPQGQGSAPPQAPLPTAQYPQAFPGPQAVVRRTDGQAIASLVCGILGILFCPIVLSIVAMVLGSQARKRIEASAGALDGESMAKAGWILGIFGLIWGIVQILFVIIFFGAMFAGRFGEFGHVGRIGF
ncbi:MAG: DUF4190 domain-containing protein [Actinomycetota bacterium]|nr:DUF4190 domain-containing protein [Actinomycetota bacterium]